MLSYRVLKLKNFEKPPLKGAYHRLVCLKGEFEGSILYLIGEKVTLGRDVHHDIHAQDLYLSKNHLEFYQKGSKLFITDLKTTNGTFVNNERISQKELQEEDIISIGGLLFKYEYEKLNASSLKISKRFLYLSLIALLLLYLQKKPSSSAPIKILPKENIIIDEEPIEKKHFIDEELEKFYKRGLRELSHKNYLRAEEEFKQALALYPKDSYASFYLQKAQDYYQKHLEHILLSAERAEGKKQYKLALNYYCSLVPSLKKKNKKDLLEKISQKVKELKINSKDYHEDHCL